MSLNIMQTWLLLLAVVFAISGFMAIMTHITKDTLDSHFDRFTIFYLIVFMATIFPLILLLIFKYSTTAFGYTLSGLIILIFLFASSSGTKYDRLGRVVYGSGDTSIFSKYWRRRQLRMRRREALRVAKTFISPYKSIFGKLVLGNKYCKVIFSKKKTKHNFKTVVCYKFFCMSKKTNSKGDLPFFEAKTFDDSVWHEEFFNSLCQNFSFNTKLENLRAIFTNDKFLIDETNYKVSQSSKVPKIKAEENTQPLPTSGYNERETEHPIKKMLETININEATEAELTALPGISIVLAKKIIHHRDYKGDFKSFEEFIKIFNIKPHFAKQLKEMIIIEPIKKQSSIQKGERIIDIE